MVRSPVRTLIVFCHPLPDSFGSCVRDTCATALEGHEVRSVDLYDGRDLPRSFSDGDASALEWARAVVLVYPTWWGSFPAPLGDWIESGLEREAWRNVSRVVAVTTHGSSRMVNVLSGGIGERVVRRGLPGRMAPEAYGRFVALYSMDTIDDDARAAFLKRLPGELEKSLR
jgi:NAD(P)H dehydrogenase (quinone)